MKTENIEALKTFIKEELADCNQKLFPKVCGLQSTENGYDRVEQMIIKLVAKEAMPIGAAIAHIEQELAHSTSE